MTHGRSLQALLVVSLTCSVVAGANAFLIREAPLVSETDCGWSYGDCGDAGPFSHWFTAIVPWRLNMDAATDANDPGLTQATIRNALAASYQTWEDVDDAVLTFTNGSDTSARVSGTDGINTSVWYDPALDLDACSGYLGQSSGVLAVTISTIDASGEIMDVDIVYDSFDTWAWSTDCGDFDLQSVATHEIGHMIGFGHSQSGNCGGAVSTKPTMCAYYGCDSGTASLRTLEDDDIGAIQCLYPELPTVVLIDQTGSMSTGGRMDAAKQVATDFVNALPDNNHAVAAFAEEDGTFCTPARPGYELLQDWTMNTGLLEAAIASTSPCGGTPLWESLCCALDKSEEMGPANVFCVTDTEENLSDGTCGCSTYNDLLSKALDASTTFYVIDITNYFGRTAETPEIASDQGTERVGDDGPLLASLCGRTGGLYFEVFSEEELHAARQAIQSHIMQFGHAKQLGVDCQPQGTPADFVQRYAGPNPDSPVLGQEITVVGVQTVPRGPFGVRTQYVEDCSGGIRFEMAGGPSGELGQLVSVRGDVSTLNGEIVISPVRQVIPLGEFPGEPETPVEDVASAHDPEMIGRLMTVRGYAATDPMSRRFPLVTELGASAPHEIEVFLYPETGIPDGAIQKEVFYEITGIVQRVEGVNRLAPRFISDIETVIVGVADGAPGAGSYGIAGVEPNPFLGTAHVRYSIPAEGHVSVRVYDVSGKLVRTLLDQHQAAERHVVSWDGRSARGERVEPGVYFVRLEGPGVTESRSVVLTR